MGLAASQARLLSITQRISDNELRAQLINNQKMRLNSESSRVSENYINALNKTNLVFANYNSEDEAQNVPLTFNNLTAFNQYNNQYNLTNTAGNVLISESDAAKYRAAKGNLEDFLKDGYGIEYTTSYWDTIGDQLKNCEAFYSNPNLDEKLEFASDADKANGISINDGSYAFFDATQLKKMYEGAETTSYAETIKTSAYTDFAGAYDEFTKELATFRQESNIRGQLIDKAVNHLISKGINVITPEKITVNDDGTLSTSENWSDSTYFTGGTAVPLSNHLPDLEQLGFKKEVSGGYSIAQDWNDILDYAKAPISQISSETANDKAVSLWDGNAIQIGAQQEFTDDEGNTTGVVTFWYDTVLGLFYKDGYGVTPTNKYIGNPSNGSIKLYEADGTTIYLTEFNWDDSTNTATWKTSNTSVSGSGTTTVAIYPNKNLTGKPPTEVAIDPSTDGHKKMIAELAANYMNTDGLKSIINAYIASGADFINQSITTTSTDSNGDTVTTTTNLFTTEELEKLHSHNDTSTPTATAPTDLIKTLSKLITGSDTTISDAGTMEKVLSCLTSGQGITPGSSGGYTLNYGGTSPINIPSDSMALINAIVCDTMMDYFGEPVYGYMKKNSLGEWVVAQEEAQWYINLFEKIQSCGYQVLAKGLANSTDWMQFALENVIVVMEQINTEQNWQPITHTSCSDIIEQTDSQAATLAEAEYNKAMRQIEAKDEMFDLELKNIDTEHASLESEYESVKKAMTGNIERTFQMYG